MGQMNLQGLQGVGQGISQIGGIGQQRLSNLQGLFGFGQNLRGLGLQESGANLALSSALEDQNRANINLGGTFGGAASTAGGNVANALLAQGGSPVGGALSSFGSGLLTSGLDRIMNPPTPTDSGGSMKQG
jgi:hypothetical protein